MEATTTITRLEKAIIYSVKEREAIYDSCGHLFRLCRRVDSKAWFYILNASLGYDPPMEPRYYAKLLLIPPTVSAMLPLLVLYRSVRGKTCPST
ncbi:hypothetical protein [Hyperthermus butylicus]|uniref:hypothetical protein n=1 Tax=Hyperthermus butylicus TaxID=54248 RepID=UPI000325838E|nr:hypothetical protein [Hyperthermus butylicus]